MRQYRIKKSRIKEVTGCAFDAAYGFRGGRSLSLVTGTPKLAGRHVATASGFEWWSASQGGYYERHYVLRPLSGETITSFTEAIQAKDIERFDGLLEQHADRSVDQRRASPDSRQFDPFYEAEMIQAILL